MKLIDLIQISQEINKTTSTAHYALKATPIYSLVLRAQEVGNEPFWNIKKS